MSRQQNAFFTFLLQALYPLLPTPVRVQGPKQYLKSCYADLQVWLAGKQDRGVPPHRLNISGGGDFRKLGRHNVTLCRTYGGLTPADSVLDVGCGIGRTALAMKDFLARNGAYTGIDVIRFALLWCQKHIGKGQANFRFVHADVQNKTYNRGGTVEARDYVFPFADDTFDFCLATPLFTHLLPADAGQYVKESGRVLRREGRFLSTWFLLDEQTTPFVDAGQAEFSFPFRFAHHAQKTDRAPEAAVAYFGTSLRQLFAQADLEIEAIHYGGWSGRPGSIDSGQDIVIARRISKIKQDQPVLLAL